MAKAYAREFGHLCVPKSYVTHDGVKLGKCLAALKAQRKRRGKGRYLAKERIAALGRLGMVWDVDKYQWEQKYEAARRYFHENGIFKCRPVIQLRTGHILGNGSSAPERTTDPAGWIRTAFSVWNPWVWFEMVHQTGGSGPQSGGWSGSN